MSISFVFIFSIFSILISLFSFLFHYLLFRFNYLFHYLFNYLFNDISLLAFVYLSIIIFIQVFSFSTLPYLDLHYLIPCLNVHVMVVSMIRVFPSRSSRNREV